MFFSPWAASFDASALETGISPRGMGRLAIGPLNRLAVDFRDLRETLSTMPRLTPPATLSRMSETFSAMSSPYRMPVANIVSTRSA